VAPVSHSREAPVCMNHRYVFCLCTISRILLPQVPAIPARLFTCRVNTERARPLHSTYPQTRDKSLAAQTHAESSPSFTFVPYQRRPTSTSSYPASECILTAWIRASSNVQCCSTAYCLHVLSRAGALQPMSRITVSEGLNTISRDILEAYDSSHPPLAYIT
jgi:hypothetical protein